MPRKSNPATLHLKKIGEHWYCNVRVPASLEKTVGNSHIRKSLHTTSLTEANRLKLPMVAKIKEDLRAMSLAHRAAKDVPAFSFSDASQLRVAIREAISEGNDSGRENLEDIAQDHAVHLEKLYGYAKAKRYFDAATVPGDTLLELQAKYLAATDHSNSTKLAHKLALSEVLAHMKMEDGQPQAITRAVAVQFFDEVLLQRKLAANTITDRLATLGSFWKWMQGRGAVREGFNPWSGHKVNKTTHASTRPTKRAYSDPELLKLLEGCTAVSGWPTLPTIRDVLILGLATGCRAEELCSLTPPQVRRSGAGYILDIIDAKTQAGVRLVGAVSPAAVRVLERRITAAAGSSGDATVRLFPELEKGGADNKYSASLSKAFGRYRRACGVPDGTDLHSLRRNAITALERAKVDNRDIARFVGHAVGTMAADVYSAGLTSAQVMEIASKVTYAPEVEAAAVKLAAFGGDAENQRLATRSDVPIAM